MAAEGLKKWQSKLLIFLDYLTAKKPIRLNKNKEMNMSALPQETLERCRAIRKAYRELEIKHHEKEWSIEEWNSLGIDCFSSTTKNKDLLTNSFLICWVLSRSQHEPPHYDQTGALLWWNTLSAGAETGWKYLVVHWTIWPPRYGYSTRMEAW